MTTMYKLTTQKLTTHNDMTWAIGKTNKATGSGVKMCTDGVLHCYSDPRLAVILNPIHANIFDPRLFEIECSTILATDGLKSCSKQQTPVKELPLPKLSINQRVAFAIKTALLVYEDKAFADWAEDWLSRADRSSYAAARATSYATRAAAGYATSDARAAAGAARAARSASYATGDASTVSFAAIDARAAARAASYAAGDASDAATGDASFGKSLITIVDWVVSNID